MAPCAGLKVSSPWPRQQARPFQAGELGPLGSRKYFGLRELKVGQAPVTALLPGKKLVVGPSFDHPSGVDDRDRAGVSNGGEPVRDDEARLLTNEIGDKSIFILKIDPVSTVLTALKPIAPFHRVVDSEAAWHFKLIRRHRSERVF
jgi:hypothetical protein